jgi:hypothetical protein
MSDQITSVDDVQAVAQAERDLAEAHLKLDLITIDQLFHSDYTIIQPGGKVESKDEVLASYRTGTRRWDSAKADELDVRIYGNTGVVVGRWTASGQNGSERFDYSARFLSTWIKQDGRWQNVTSQSTEIV